MINIPTTIQTSSFNDWVYEQDTTDLSNGIADLATAQYLSDMFAGFMIEPSGFNDDGIRLISKSYEFCSIDEITDFLSSLIIDYEIYLYSLTFWPSIPYAIDEFVKPEFTKPCWKIRCAFLKKQ